MVRKSAKRFSEKIMRNTKPERDDASSWSRCARAVTMRMTRWPRGWPEAGARSFPSGPRPSSDGALNISV